MLLAAYRRQVRADLRRFFGVDLMAAFRGDMGLTELCDLVTTLAELDGSTARALNDGPVWQTEHYLAADTVEALTGERHPGRPTRNALRGNTADPERIAAKERALARKRQREADIRDGIIK